MFSPTLFADYYWANKWNMVDLLFFRYVPTSEVPRWNTNLWDIYSYVPGSLWTWIYGQGYKGLYGIVAIAQKTECSTFDAPVYQNGYYEWLSTATKSKGLEAEAVAREFLKKKTFLQGLTFRKHVPLRLRNAIRPLYSSLFCQVGGRLPLKCHLKLVARY